MGRASLVVGAVAGGIFVLCVAMVTLTLHLTPEMERLAAGERGCVKEQIVVPGVLAFEQSFFIVVHTVPKGLQDYAVYLDH